MVLERVSCISDLGVIMDQRNCFTEHIDVMVKMLEFKKRVFGEFKDPYTSKALNMSLVRPIFEYSSWVWASFYDLHVTRVGASEAY
jgi:hypothetical protein